MPLIPAATLIAMRDRPGAAPELLMLRRHAALAFAGDAWVFPGGRVDDDDRLLAERLGGDDADDMAARIAAIRETIEEVGLAIALDPPPDAAGIAGLRDALRAGVAFSALLDRDGRTLRPDQLLPFARWAPPIGSPRSFDTRFYLIAIGEDAPLGVDGAESIDLCWTAAQAMIDRWAAGDAKLLFPTRANLARIARHASFAEAARAAGAVPVRLIQTILEACADGVILRIPPGHDYPPLTQLERAQGIIRGTRAAPP